MKSATFEGLNDPLKDIALHDEYSHIFIKYDSDVGDFVLSPLKYRLINIEGQNSKLRTNQKGGDNEEQI
jgi:uncharacterized protein YutD